MSTLTEPFRRIWHAVHHTVLVSGLVYPRAGKRQMKRSVAVRRFYRRWPPDPGWRDEGGSGVREPRRPRSNPPAGSIALQAPTDLD